MTREERIDSLNISEEQKKKIHNIYLEYEDEKEKRTLGLLGWRLKELLPKSQLLLEERYKSRQEVKCLFVLVGTTLEPLLLSILTIRPTSKIILIYSPESEIQKNQIIATLRQIHGSSDIIPKELLSDVSRAYIENISSVLIDQDTKIEDTSPEKVFNLIKNRIDDFQVNEIGVDITGGKKSMVGGGFIAAAINNYHLFYIDFDEYIDEHPMPGTEFIHILDNPYDIYNIREEERIHSLWKRRDYDAIIEELTSAIEKLKKKANKYGLNHELQRLEKMLVISQCYREWAKFNYSVAYRHIKQSVAFNLYVKKHNDILSTIVNCKPTKMTVLCVILLSIDRWSRGRDAYLNHEYDLAALRFTQVVEVLTKYRLKDMIYNGYVELSGDQRYVEHIDVSLLINFLWFDKKNYCSGIKTEKLEINWSDGCKCCFENNVKPSKGAMISKLQIRNEFAHFNCYSEEQKKKDHINVESFRDMAKKLIELFIETYKSQSVLKHNTFQTLQPVFDFVEYNDFRL